MFPLDLFSFQSGFKQFIFIPNANKNIKDKRHQNRSQHEFEKGAKEKEMVEREILIPCLLPICD